MDEMFLPERSFFLVPVVEVDLVSAAAMGMGKRRIVHRFRDHVAPEEPIDQITEENPEDDLDAQ